MSQFRATLQRLKQANKGQINNGFEITDKNQISESINETLKDEQNPPAMMVLRRQGIRIFPDGRRVALYTNKQLGLTFTIPYTSSGTQPSTAIPGVQTEEVELVMETLEQVSAYASEENPKSTAKHMKFADGSKLKVSHGAAKAIHMVHGALNDANKKTFETMLSDPKGFEKAAHFALSKVNFSINK